MGARVLLVAQESTKQRQALRSARIVEQVNMLSQVQHPARRVPSTRTHLPAAQSLRHVYAKRDTSDRVVARVWRVVKANTPLFRTVRHAPTAARVNTQHRQLLRVNLCALLVQPIQKPFNLAKARLCRAVSVTTDGKGQMVVHVHCVPPGNTKHRRFLSACNVRRNRPHPLGPRRAIARPGLQVIPFKHARRVRPEVTSPLLRALASPVLPTPFPTPSEAPRV